MAFTPRSAKRAKVRYGGATITAKKWSVEPTVAGKADVTNFEGTLVAGPSGNATAADALMVEQTLACTVKLTFSIELDADAAANLYDAGVRVGNASSPLKLYLNDVTGPLWTITTPLFESVPMTADVKGALGHTIRGEGSGTFTYPTGNF